MILDLIFLVVQGILEILLSPLTILNIAIDFIASVPVITSFLQIIAYVLPWVNILPLIGLLVAIFTFRIVLSVIRVIWSFIPFFR